MKINEDNPLPVRKIRSDSTWCALTKLQREKLEAWLCDEGLSYREVQCRAPKELGATLSVSCLGRLCQRMLRRRSVVEMEELRQTALITQSAGIKLEDLRNSTLTLIGSRMMKTAMQGGDINELAALGKLLSDADRRQIQRERLALASKRFQQNERETGTSQAPNADGTPNSAPKAEQDANDQCQ